MTMGKNRRKKEVKVPRENEEFPKHHYSALSVADIRKLLCMMLNKLFSSREERLEADARLSSRTEGSEVSWHDEQGEEMTGMTSRVRR